MEHPLPTGQPEPVEASDRDDPLLACLAHIAGRFGSPFSDASVLGGLPLRNQRLSVDLFERAAQRVGFDTRVVQRGVRKVPGIVLPAIILLENGDACVLLKRNSRRTATVVFPLASDKPRRIKLADLERDASGSVIFVTPADAPDNRTNEALLPDARSGHWFWSSVWPLWPSWLQIVLAAMLINTLALAFPLFVMNVYDRVIPNLSISTLWALAAGVGVALIFDFVLKQLRAVILDQTGRRVDMRVAALLYEHAMAVSMAARRETSGGIASKIREFEAVRDFFTSSSIIALTDLAFIAIFVAVLWYIVGPIAYIPMLAVLVVLVTTLAIQTPLSKAVRRSQQHATRRHEILVDGLVGIETIKAVAGEGHMQRRWEEAIASTARANSETKAWSSLAIYLTGSIQQCVGVLVIVWGVFLVADGTISVGGLIAASILSGRVLAPLGSIVMTLARAQQARTAMRDLTAFMALARDQGAKVASGEKVRRGGVEFRNVTFSYPSASLPAVNDVSFKVEAGERVGIIGKIGSGKTSIGKLLCALYTANDGTILIDDCDIRRYEVAELRDGIGFVSQESELFSGTVRDNIILGKPDAREDEILEAARVSGVAAFAATHPLGLNIPTGERGRELSGGQRQAVALARMLLRKPKILFFDEPSSAMDTATEAKLIEDLRKATRGQTVFVCSHRVSFLGLVDRLLVVDGGRLVASGPRDDILKALKAPKTGATVTSLSEANSRSDARSKTEASNGGP
ncbi:MAG: type I secretion system permease/ATPase [Hyphomicrobiaceae bacterium]